MPTVYERTLAVVIDKLDTKEEVEVNATSAFREDLDADSIDLVTMIMGLEEEFSTQENPIQISDEDAGDILTLQDAIDYLKRHGIEDGQDS